MECAQLLLLLAELTPVRRQCRSAKLGVSIMDPDQTVFYGGSAPACWVSGDVGLRWQVACNGMIPSMLALAASAAWGGSADFPLQLSMQQGVLACHP